VVSHRSEGGRGILDSKTGRGKYDMLYDRVVKVYTLTTLSHYLLLTSTFILNGTCWVFILEFYRLFLLIIVLT
jgi:hypothetical protein